jgi:hypothetical protein
MRSIAAFIAQESIRMTEQGKLPRAVLKLTRTGKGVLIAVPDPNTQSTHLYITSVSYLKLLLDGTLKKNLLGCLYLGEETFEKFLIAEEKELKVNTLTTSGTPLSVKASIERERQAISIKDDW